jgi:hypothetical protein
MPELASYGEPFPQLAERMAFIGVGLPLAAPLATPVVLGVLSLWPEMSTTWPGQVRPGMVTVASLSWNGYVWLPDPLQHGAKWSFAVRNFPIGPMCASSVFVDSLFHHE